MNATNKLLDFFKNLKNEDFSEMRQEIDQRIEEERKFFNSERFKNIISQIKEELNNVPRIGDNPYTDILFGDVTNEEFNLVFDCIFDHKVSGLNPKKFAQEDDYYSEEFRVFEGLTFSMMSGQGIALAVYKT